MLFTGGTLDVGFKFACEAASNDGEYGVAGEYSLDAKCEKQALDMGHFMPITCWMGVR